MKNTKFFAQNLPPHVVTQCKRMSPCLPPPYLGDQRLIIPICSGDDSTLLQNNDGLAISTNS